MISAVTLLIFLAFTGCTHVITNPVILKQKSPRQIANKICLAIMLSDLAKEDSGFKEKAAAVVEQLAKYLTPLEDGKFSIDEAFDRIRSISDKQGKPLVDPQISVIVELALEDELAGYLEIPGGHKEKLQKLTEIIEIVNRKLKKIGGK
ncbi:MAG: hypothetical protein ACE5GM_10770 [bacterium]